MGSIRNLTAAALVCLCSAYASAATVAWDNDSGDGNWSTATNWSGDALPGTADDVVFDATSTDGCTVDAEVDYVNSVTLATGYGAVLTLSANLHVHGACTIEEGTVNCNGNELHLRGSGSLLNFSGGGLGVGEGLVVFEADTSTTINIPAGGQGQWAYHSMKLEAIGTVDVAFDLAGDVTHFRGLTTEAPDGAIITLNTNDHALQDGGGGSLTTSSTGATTLNFGASTVSFSNSINYKNANDIVNMGSCQLTTARYWVWNLGVTIDEGTSHTIITQELGVNWLGEHTFTFYDLTLAPNAGDTVRLQYDVEVLNELTIGPGTLETVNSQQYRTNLGEDITVAGNVTVDAGATINATSANGDSTLTLNGAAAQTLTDESSTIWPSVVLDTSADVTLGADLGLGGLTVSTGATLTLDTNDLTGGGALSNDGMVVQSGNETVTIGADGDSGTWRLIGSAAGASPPFTIPNLTVTGADFFDLEVYCTQTNVFTVAEGDLRIAGDLHVDNAATLNFSAADTMPVLTIEGVFTGNQANIDDTTRLVIQGATGNRLSVVFDATTGDVGTGAADTPNYVSFKRLMAPGVTFTPKRTMTWTGLVFSDLDASHASGAYYLSVPNAGFKLTLDDVEFQDVLGGVDGDGSFDTATDPGTISAASPGASPVVDITSYAVSGLAYGGTATDADTDGSYITWAALIIPAFSLLTPVDAVTGFAPVDGSLTWEQPQYVETYSVTITDGASFNHTEDDITTESWTPGLALLDYDTTYTWYVTAHNADGDTQSTETTWTFTTKSDNDAPTVLSTTPVDGETNVPVSTTISVTFSEAMAAGTDLDFHLRTGGIDVTGTTTHVGDMVTFTPDADLANGTNYTITIDATAEDLNGNPLGGFTASFSTVAAPVSAESACVPGEGSPATMVFLVFAAIAVVVFGRRAPVGGTA